MGQLSLEEGRVSYCVVVLVAFFSSVVDREMVVLPNIYVGI